jgi:hypothetical protein
MLHSVYLENGDSNVSSSWECGDIQQKQVFSKEVLSSSSELILGSNDGSRATFQTPEP